MYNVLCTMYIVPNTLYILNIPSQKIIFVESLVRKGKVKGAITVPSSKSILQRFLVAALLSEDETELHAVSHCSDTISCLNAVQTLGAKVIEEKDGLLKIKGSGKSIHAMAHEINCGESGFALRALTAVAALSGVEIEMTGSGTLLNRPVGFMTDVLSQLGVQCNSDNGWLPLRLKGPVKFRNIVVDGSLSSQFLSGLLMIFPLADEDHVIEVRSLKSLQYIDLTLEVLKNFGVEIKNQNYMRFMISGRQHYKGCKVSVEGDWSSASCMLVAGATTGEVMIKNLSLKSSQPDKIMLQVLKESGAEVLFGENEISVKKPDQKKLKPFYFDATDCPDLFPALTVLATQCSGTSEIAGVERLIHKESNRAIALQQEFSKLGGLISIEGNTMKIEGSRLKGAAVHSHHDHRIAMALAIAGLNTEGEVVIADSEAVDKSYPEFFNDLSRIITYE